MRIACYVKKRKYLLGNRTVLARGAPFLFFKKEYLFINVAHTHALTHNQTLQTHVDSHAYTFTIQNTWFHPNTTLLPY